MFEVEMSAEAHRQLDELHGTIHARVLKLIERLADWPDVSGVKPLRGKLAGHYRLRTGDYRLQFYGSSHFRVGGKSVFSSRAL